jgi:hypothetical protein
LPGAVQDAQYQYGSIQNSVDHEIRRSKDNQFSRPTDTANPTAFRKLRQPFDLATDPFVHCHGGSGASASM